MPFEWFHYNVPTWYSDTFQEKRFNMYLDGMRVKATLLRNLGYDKEYVKMRIKGNIRWAYEMTEVPGYLEKVDEVVEDIYSKEIPTVR